MPTCHVQYPWRGALYPVMGKAQSAQSDNASKFPVAAGLASTAHGTDNMLEKLPVGTMAGILRVSLRNGFRRYKPVDIKLLPKYVTPHIEPGRLDVRVDEFYSRATLEQVHEERKKEKEQRKLEEERKLAGKEGGGGGGAAAEEDKTTGAEGIGTTGSGPEAASKAFGRSRLSLSLRATCRAGKRSWARRTSGITSSRRWDGAKGPDSGRQDRAWWSPSPAQARQVSNQSR
ncbi:unnamed protein product, partial [Ectocarpus fasciculatus]